MKRLFILLLALAAFTFSASAAAISNGDVPTEPIEIQEPHEIEAPTGAIAEDKNIPDEQEILDGYKKVLQIAENDKNIAAVVLDGDIIWVELREGCEQYKEYAKLFQEEVGDFVVMTNNTQAATQSAPAIGAEYGADTSNSFILFWVIAAFLLLLAAVVTLKRKALVSANETPIEPPILSRKAVISAVKTTYIPSEKVWNNIRKELEQ